MCDFCRFSPLCRVIHKVLCPNGSFCYDRRIPLHPVNRPGSGCWCLWEALSKDYRQKRFPRWLVQQPLRRLRRCDHGGRISVPSEPEYRCHDTPVSFCPKSTFGPRRGPRSTDPAPQTARGMALLRVALRCPKFFRCTRIRGFFCRRN